MSANIMERLREALAAVQNFRGDLDSDAFEDVCAGLRFSATQAAPSLLAQLDAQAAEITRLRAALAQAGAPKPIGYMNEGHLHELQMGRLPYGYVYPSAGVGAETPIYTAHASPAQREPLSDAQIDSAPALTLAEYSVRVGRHELRQFARQIEAACAAAWGVELAESGTKGAA